LQEEAPIVGKPVLVLREETERPEGVAAGTAKLVGTDETVILTEASRLVEDTTTYSAMARRGSLYGDGRAAERIVDILRRYVAGNLATSSGDETTLDARLIP
jgi:UDP-N-acetylglucosamine 2-epimerase (non-hydrolysing)